MIVNGVVEFYKDSADNNRMHLANPMAVVQGMDFEINSVPGEQPQTLTPFYDVPVDQEHAPLNHGTQLEQDNPLEFMQSLEFALPMVQQPQMNSCALQPSGYQAHAWDPNQAQQWSTMINQGQDMINQGQDMTNYGQDTPAMSSSEVAYSMPYRQFNYPAISPTESCAGPQQPISPTSRKRKSPESDSSQETAGKETSPSENGENVARPRNAFFQFRSHMYYKLRHENPKLTGGQVSSLCGKIWGTLSDEEKQPWKDKAVVEAAEHKIQNPNWSYRPGQKKARREKAKAMKAAKAQAAQAQAA
ncbi:hypothetical protein EKO27_g3055 [Xylaria grammica]|uniref:HMG box domain-containing protein n=1 Tax=Xylaria grammica TaxID=363999 RepID=A0A439DCC2_9PEZI|nr:hypothetical protein EKO27_g3055 [Xylaria grammica]